MLELEGVDQTAPEGDGHGAVAQVEGITDLVTVELFQVETQFDL